MPISGGSSSASGRGSGNGSDGPLSINKTRKNYALAFCVATMVVFFSTESFAQRPVDSIPTSMGCYRQAITPISDIPTLHSDMPLDCLLGYVYFDSLCRSVSTYLQLDTMISQVTSWDTMKVFMRFMYEMQQYDADLFEEYLYAAQYFKPLLCCAPIVRPTPVLESNATSFRCQEQACLSFDGSGYITHPCCRYNDKL